jgi:hypothetical protein
LTRASRWGVRRVVMGYEIAVALDSTPQPRTPIPPRGTRSRELARIDRASLMVTAKWLRDLREASERSGDWSGGGRRFSRDRRV